MVDELLQPPATGGCQARPRAARPGYREDMLCASAASTSVLFRTLDVAVCRIHEAVYGRWETQAETNASAKWLWPVER